MKTCLELTLKNNRKRRSCHEQHAWFLERRHTRGFQMVLVFFIHKVKISYEGGLVK